MGGYSHEDAKRYGDIFNTAVGILGTAHATYRATSWAVGRGGPTTRPSSTGCAGGECAGDGTCFVAGTPVRIADGFESIEKVQVGARARTFGEEHCAGSELEHESDRLIVLTMHNPDGSGDELSIRLARPRAWLEANRIRRGEYVRLNLEELGVGTGSALIRDVLPMPVVETGPGCLVTGTVTHLSDDVRRVFLSDQSEPLEATNVHPLYSLDRQRFVQVDDLRRGERLRTARGVSRVERIEARPGVARVFNLEIEREHTYLVSDLEIWVHNACARNLTDEQLIDYVEDLMYRDKRSQGGAGTHGLVHRYAEQVNGASRPGSTSWDNHEQAILQQQSALRGALSEMVMRGMVAPDDAWKLATMPPPAGNQQNIPPAAK